MEAHARTNAKNVVECDDIFAESRNKFDSLITRLQRAETLKESHSKIEADLDVEGRELLRQLFQDHLKLRAKEEERRLGVKGSEGIERREVTNSSCPLKLIFGKVEVERLAYRAPRKKVGNLMPMDAELNLPQEIFSFGLQKRAAFELAKWAGLYPGNNESAGKRFNGAAMKGNEHLRTALVEAAQAPSAKRVRTTRPSSTASRPGVATSERSLPSPTKFSAPSGMS
jgi:hypothetical protein